MARKSSTDLTEGNIAKQLIIFALPILMGQVFQNLYNSVDSIVVGNFVSTQALAAVTSSADISRLLVGFFTGLAAGSGVLFSRYFGAKDEKNLHDAIHTGLFFSLILGVTMAVVGIIITPLLLKMVDCPADVWNDSVTYLRIYFIGVLFTSLYNVASGVLRAVGDSRHPFYYLVAASCTNIVLDLLFVAVFQMGVAGVAIATIISQFLSVTLAVRQMLTTNDVYKLIPKDLKIDGRILKEVLVLGLPAAIQSGLISLSNLFVQRYINGFGSAAMAGTGAAKKIDNYVGMVAMSLGQATPAFIGQNMGAKKPERAFRGLWTVVGLGFATIAVIGPVIFFNAEFFVRLFTKDAAAVAYGVG
ncbi:MAG: MATE family efflux transporter, partial [Oscillospiraceae bacterium]|nr:MATE family efflux transporter [Oscillospiraceae bacterium]